MKEESLISIIVPVYNAEKYVHRCLKSIISQTYKNLEIIVVNDGSTDGTGDIINQIAQTDSRVILLNKKNAGVSQARNSGLDIAKGKYVGFVDSDDYIAPAMYQMLIGRINEDKTDMAICGAYNDAGHGEPVPLKFLYENEVVSIKQYLEYMANGLYSVYYGAMWNKLYAMDLMKNRRFNPKISYAEDFLMNTDIFKDVRTVSVCSECCYYYNIEKNDSLSRKQNSPLLIWKINSGKINRFKDLCVQKDVYDKISDKLDEALLYELIGPVYYYIHLECEWKEKVLQIEKLLNHRTIKKALENVKVSDITLKIMKKNIAKNHYKRIVRDLYILEKIKGLIR